MKPILIIPIFLVLVTIFSFLCAPIYKTAIEKDLTDKTNLVLKEHIVDQSTIDSLNVKFNGHELHMDDSAMTSDQRSKVLDELDGIIGAYIPEVKTSSLISTDKSKTTSDGIIVKADASSPTTNKTPIIPKAHLPYIKVKEIDANKTVTISGQVASTNEKQQILLLFSTLQEQGSQSREIIDQIEVADHVTTINKVKELSQLGTELVNQAENASLDYSNNSIEITGLMHSENDILKITNSLDSLYENDNVNSEQLRVIEQTKLAFKVERLSNNKIIVSGILPDEAQGQALYDLISESNVQSIGDQEVNNVANKLRYTSRHKGAWWKNMPAKFVPDFLNQTKGIAKIEYTDSGLYIEGMYIKAKDYQTARETFKNIPEDLELYDEFLTLEGEKIAESKTLPNIGQSTDDQGASSDKYIPVTKVQKFDAKLQESAVYFKSGSAWISNVAAEKIKVAAKTIQQNKYIKTKLVVGGYADTKGDAKLNQALSLQRAQSVRERLIKLGIPKDRLIVKHFGEETKGSSKEDLKRSRRVEISTLKN